MSTQKKQRNDGGQAFPTPHCSDQHCDCTNIPGMTLRQWYKGMAMQGILASDRNTTGPNPTSAAKYAAEYADALIAEDEE